MIKRVENAEDYRDYLADKGLHEAYKARDEMQVTHSNDRLTRMWVEHYKREDVNPPASDSANTGGHNGR